MPADLQRAGRQGGAGRHAVLRFVTVATFGADLGLRFAVAPRVQLGVRREYFWTGDLSDLEGLAGTGLENLNDSSSRWTLPVLGTITIRF